MGNLWLNIKIWTKAVITVLVLAYILLFLVNNSSTTPFWLFFGRTEVSLPLAILVLLAFILGAVATLLWRFVRSIFADLAEQRKRARDEALDKLQKDQAAKAASLQTKPLPKDD